MAVIRFSVIHYSCRLQNNDDNIYNEEKKKRFDRKAKKSSGNLEGRGKAAPHFALAISNLLCYSTFPWIIQLNKCEIITYLVHRINVYSIGCKNANQSTREERGRAKEGKETIRDKSKK